MAKIKHDPEYYYDTSSGDYYALNPDGSYDQHTNNGARTSSLTTLLAGEDQTNNVLRTESQGEYETVAASQTAQVLGTTGAIGDHIRRLVIVPATTAPGNVLLLDNATSITIYTGGTVGADLTPIIVDLDMISVSGAWKVTTGANVSVVAVGRFT